MNCSGSESVSKQLSSGDKLWMGIMGECRGSYSEELPYVRESISYFESACSYFGLITTKKVGRILYTILSLFFFPLGWMFLVWVLAGFFFWCFPYSVCWQL